MNEMAVESRQRSMVSDHATAELMCLKTQLQQTSSQLSDAQQILAGKVSWAVYTQCNLLYNPLYNQLHHVDICPTCCTVGLRTGCIVYTDIQPVVQLVVQWVVSCKHHIRQFYQSLYFVTSYKIYTHPIFLLTLIDSYRSAWSLQFYDTSLVTQFISENFCVIAQSVTQFLMIAVYASHLKAWNLAFQTQLTLPEVHLMPLLLVVPNKPVFFFYSEHICPVRINKKCNGIWLKE